MKHSNNQPKECLYPKEGVRFWNVSPIVMENTYALWVLTPGDWANPDDVWALKFCALGLFCISWLDVDKPTIISLDHSQVASEARKFNYFPKII